MAEKQTRRWRKRIRAHAEARENELYLNAQAGPLFEAAAQAFDDVRRPPSLRNMRVRTILRALEGRTEHAIVKQFTRLTDTVEGRMEARRVARLRQLKRRGVDVVQLVKEIKAGRIDPAAVGL